MKKYIALVLTLMLIIGSTPAAYAAALPSDVAGTPFEKAVTALMEKGVVAGYPDGKFYPLNQISRVEACKIIITTFNAQPVSGSSGFSDMAGYGWADNYVSYAKKAGIIQGYGDGTFKPGNPVTENELITMAVRALGYTDQSIGGQWPTNYIEKAKTLGLLQNIGLGENGYATRGLTALIAYNASIKADGFNDTDSLGLIIEKTADPGSEYNKIKLIDSEGSVLNLKLPVASTLFAELESGDIVAYAESDLIITGLVQKDAQYAANKSFVGSESYNGISVDSAVAIFTYGGAADFSAEKAIFTDNEKKYGINSLKLMKNVTTSAYYVLENNKITAMVIPADEGFTGRVYGLVGDIGSAVNAAGSQVDQIDLYVGKELISIYTNGKAILPTNATYEDTGELYELYLSNGTARDVADANGFGTVRGDRFVELTTDGDFMTIISEEDMFVSVDTGSEIIKVGIMDDVVVYTLDDHGYGSGTASGIKEHARIRAFDVTDDQVDYADIVVIDERSDR